jgi:hypothetical protein
MLPNGIALGRFNVAVLAEQSLEGREANDVIQR